MLNSNGITFKEALELIQTDFRSKNRVWASYGAYDLNQFKKQCASTRNDYPFSNNHINVKTLFTQKMNLNKAVSMSKALKILKLPLEGTHHRGIDDAKNIAKILRWILNN